MPFPINSGGRRNEGPPGPPSPPPAAAPVAAWTTNADGLEMVGPGFVLVAVDQSTGAIERRLWNLLQLGGSVINAASGGLSYTYELPATLVDGVKLLLEIQNRAIGGQDFIEITVPMPPKAETADPIVSVTNQTVLPGVALLVEVIVGLGDREKYATSMIIDWGDGQQTTVFTGTPSENFWPLAEDDLNELFFVPFLHTYTTPGTYTIRVDSVSIHGVESTTADVTFTAAPDLQLDTIEGPPVYATSGSYHPVDLTASFNGAGSCTSISVNWGDGTSETITRAASTASAEFSHRYAITSTESRDDAALDRTIIVTATGPGGVDTEQRAIMLPPAPPAPSGVSVQLTTLSSSYISGVKVRATFDASGLISARTVAWGDGSVQALPDGVTTADHSYPSKVTPQDVTITFTASGPGGSTSATATLNWPQPDSPLISASFVEVSRTVSLITYAITYASTGGPVSAMTIDYDDGAGAVPLALPATGGSAFTKSYLHQDATHTITIVATGPTGLTGVTVLTISTAASATTIGITSATLVPSAGSFLATVSFAATNATSATIDWDDGSGPQAVLLSASSATKLYAAIPSGVRSVVVAAANSITGQTASAAIDLTVPAQSPVLSASVQSTAYDGTNTTATIVFTSTGEISQQSINWGDGTTWTSPTNITAGPSTAEVLSHTYSGAATDANYTVTLTVTGLAGTTPAVQTFTVLVQAVTPPSGTSYVKLQVYNGSLTALVNHPVGGLVSFSQAEAFTSFTTFRVYASGENGGPTGNPLPAQYKVLSRWHALRSDTNAFFKNVWVTFPTTIPAATNDDDAGVAIYWLQLDATRATVTPAAITVQESASVFSVVQVDQPTYVVSKTQPSLLHSATLPDGSVVVQPDASSLFEYADQGGARSITVSSTVIEEGTINPPGSTSPVTNVKVVIRQTGTFNDGSSYPPKYTARWIFLQGIPDVEFTFTIRNPRRPNGNTTNLYSYTGARSLTENSLYIEKLTLGLKLASVSEVKAQRAGSAVASTALAGGEHYRVQQTFRNRYHNEKSAVAYDDDFPGSQAADTYDVVYDSSNNLTTEHMLQLRDGIEGIVPTVTQEMYPGAVHAVCPTGGLTIAMEHFAHMAPKAFRVSQSGQVRAAMFPDKMPGEVKEHLRTGDLRPYNGGSLLAPMISLGTNSRPWGTNPASGQPWTTADIPTQLFPDGPANTIDSPAGEAKPVVAGVSLNQVSPGGVWIWAVHPVGSAVAPAWYLKGSGLAVVQPISSTPAAFRTHYPVVGGMQVTMRLRFRATAAAPASVSAYADVTDNPPIALSAPERLRTTRGPTTIPWVERGDADYATEALAPEPDLKRGEQWLSALATNSAADAITVNNVTNLTTQALTNSASARYGMPSFLRLGGSRVSLNASRAVGWDVFGNLRYDDKYSNLHYDLLQHLTTAMLRYRGARVYGFYRHARIFHAWARDRMAPLTDDPTYSATGVNYYESCYPHGQSTAQSIPQMSHNFKAGLALSYVLFNDEGTFEALRYAARPLFLKVIGYAPTSFAGNYGSRFFAWAVRAAAEIYHVAGPLAVPTPAGGAVSEGTVAVPYAAASGGLQDTIVAGHIPVAGDNLARLLIASLQRWEGLQSGAIKPHGGVYPCNFIANEWLSGAAETNWPTAATTVTYGGRAGREYSNNGVLFYGAVPSAAFSVSSPVSAGGVYGAFSPFMEVFNFSAMAAALRTIDGMPALGSGPSLPAVTLAQQATVITSALLFLHRMRIVIRNSGCVIGAAATPGYSGNVTRPAGTTPTMAGTPVVADGTETLVLGTSGTPFLRQRTGPRDRVQRQIDAYPASGSVTATGQVLFYDSSSPTYASTSNTCHLMTLLFAEAYLLFSEYNGKAKPDGSGVFTNHLVYNGQQHDLELMKYFYRAGVRFYDMLTPSNKDTAAPPATVYNGLGLPAVIPYDVETVPASVVSIDLTKGKKQLHESFLPGIAIAAAARFAAGEIINP